MSQVLQTKIINKIAQRTKFNPDGIELSEISNLLNININTILDNVLKLEQKNLLFLGLNSKVKLAPLYYTQNFYLNLRKNETKEKMAGN